MKLGDPHTPLSFVMVTVCACLCFLHAACLLNASCDEAVSEQVPSLTGEYVAILAVRNCGATTDYSSIVKVAPAGRASDESDIVFVVSGDREIRLRWQDDSTLEIDCENCTSGRIFKQLQRYQGVTVRY